MSTGRGDTTVTTPPEPPVPVVPFCFVASMIAAGAGLIGLVVVAGVVTVVVIVGVPERLSGPAAYAPTAKMALESNVMCFMAWLPFADISTRPDVPRCGGSGQVAGRVIARSGSRAPVGRTQQGRDLEPRRQERIQELIRHAFRARVPDDFFASFQPWVQVGRGALGANAGATPIGRVVPSTCLTDLMIALFADEPRSVCDRTD